jgi:hypothetical protein
MSIIKRIPNIFQVIDHLPLPKSLRLSWQKLYLDGAYRRDIRTAKIAKDYENIDILRCEHGNEIDLIEEEEDSLFTNHLLRQAQRFRVPIPSYYTYDKKQSDDWRQGRNLGLRCLTDQGIAKLREEIRKEMRWKHERRAHYVAWFSAIIGVIGALTGLIAVLYRK